MQGDFSTTMKEAFELWKTIETRELLDCHIFSVHEHVREGPHKKTGKFITLHAPQWAIIVPVLERQGKRFFITVTQYRHGTEQLYHEFPGGVIEQGEEPRAAALRELLEETGYTAGILELLGTFSPNPAFMDNTQYVFLAQNLVKTSEQKLDEHEFVHVCEVPESEVLAQLGHGEWGHGLMAAAGFLYLQYCYKNQFPLHQ